MMDHILKAKHWQIFLLKTAPPFIMFIPLIYLFFTQIGKGMEGINLLITFAGLFAAASFISVIIMIAWWWAIGITLQNYLPEHLKINTLFFKLCIFLPVLISWSLFALMIYMILYSEMQLWIVFAFFPLYLVATGCMYYVFIFAARVLKTVEMQRKVTFTDYFVEALLIWIHVAGIWIIQPRLNKIVAGKPGQNNVDVDNSPRVVY